MHILFVRYSCTVYLGTEFIFLCVYPICDVGALRRFEFVFWYANVSCLSYSLDNICDVI